ncbi:aspartyl/Asparaginyl beta-hydroxylase family protein [Burkholderia sp. ABCPW 111]|nr:aspartyl/Asparaginyl beta-hydroxylase family protein [Burkholderia sp. ABCPW 111]
MFRLRVLHRAEYAVFDESHFPEFAILRREWNTFRDEALALRDDSRIKASGEYDDIGFNSFFRKGWKRFCLKWYDRPHPSALAHRPRSLAILSKIPSVKAAMFAQLPPGGKLGLHRDSYAGALRDHLGLATPNDDERRRTTTNARSSSTAIRTRGATARR